MEKTLEVRAEDFDGATKIMYRGTAYYVKGGSDIPDDEIKLYLGIVDHSRRKHDISNLKAEIIME